MDQSYKLDCGLLNESSLDAPRNKAVDSMGSRIRMSASGLMGDLLARPSSYDEVSTLALASQSGDKGNSASASVNLSGPTLSSVQHNSPTTYIRNGEHRYVAPLPIHNSFRQRQQDGAKGASDLKMDFETFTSDSDFHFGFDQSFCPFEDGANPCFQGLESCSVKKDKQRAELLHEYSSRQINQESVELLDNEADGAGVVALLSKHDYDLSQSIESLQWEEKACLQGDHKKFSERNLTETHTYPYVVSNTLSLLPDFSSDESSIETEQALLDREETIFRIRSPGLISKDNGLLPWIDMLGSYHDQVWGNLLPLIQEPYLEVKEIETAGHGRSQESSTVRRLSMILGHMGHSNNRIFALPPI